MSCISRREDLKDIFNMYDLIEIKEAVIEKLSLTIDKSDAMRLMLDKINDLTPTQIEAITNIINQK